MWATTGYARFSHFPWKRFAGRGDQAGGPGRIVVTVQPHRLGPGKKKKTLRRKVLRSVLWGQSTRQLRSVDRCVGEGSARLRGEEGRNPRALTRERLVCRGLSFWPGGEAGTMGAVLLKSSCGFAGNAQDRG